MRSDGAQPHPDTAAPAVSGVESRRSPPHAVPGGGPRDEFLSEEDLDLENLTWDEVVAYWNLWLQQAQATNDLDADLYEHGVFDRDPAPRRGSGGAQRD